MPQLKSLRPPRAALTAVLATAGLLGGVPAAQAAVTLSYDAEQRSFRATSDGSGDTIIVKDGPGNEEFSSTTAIQVPGTTANDPDGDGGNCTASGDTATCLSVSSLSVEGGGGADTLTDQRSGGFVSFRASGGDGDDTITASARGGFGFSTLEGGSGNDTLTGGPSSRDFFVPGPGADKVRGGNAPTDPAVEPYKSFLDDGGQPADFQRDFGYIDSVSYADGAGVTVSLDDQANDGAAGEGDDIGSDVEEVSGTNADDTLTAGASSAELRGRLGNDTLNGGAGNDFLTSGAGADNVIGGAGSDTARGFSRFGPRPVNAPPGFVSPKLGFTITLDDVANDGQTGAGEGDNVHTDVESVGTGSGNDSITGSGGADDLSSGSGNDTVTGGGGADVLDAGDGNDSLNVQDGITDRADGGRGNDSAVADLGGGQPDKADVLFNVESITGTPLPFVIDVTKIPAPSAPPAPPAPPVTPANVAPKLTVSGLTVKSAAFLKAGTFSLRVTTNEPARVVADLLGRSRYRAVGELIVGTGRLGLATGRRTVKVSVGKSNLRTFKRKLRTKAQKKKGISLKVRIVATDAQGLATATNKRVTIKG